MRSHAGLSVNEVEETDARYWHRNTYWLKIRRCCEFCVELRARVGDGGREGARRRKPRWSGCDKTRWRRNLGHHRMAIIVLDHDVVIDARFLLEEGHGRIHYPHRFLISRGT